MLFRSGVMKRIGGQSVIEPIMKSDSMEAVLSIFRGTASISEGNAQLNQIDAAVGSGRGIKADTTTTTSVPGELNQTLAQQRFSVTPPNDPTCR